MNRITGFFGGGRKDDGDSGREIEKTDMAVGAEGFSGGDFGRSAPRVGGACPSSTRCAKVPQDPAPSRGR